MMKCACKDCTKRFVGCHATCTSYAEYRAEIDSTRKEKNARKSRNTMTNRKIKMTGKTAYAKRFVDV